MPVTQEPQLKQQLRRALCDQAVAIRDRKRLVEEKWLRSRRTWMGDSIPSYIPTDTAKGHKDVPSARRIAERTITRCTKMITPTAKWHQVSALGTTDQNKLSNIDVWMTYILRKRIKSRSNISQLSRCMLMYGMCALRTSVSVKNGKVWPAQRAVDPFALYIFPETAPTLDECEIIFEDFLFSYERYRTFVAKGIVDDIPRSDFGKPDWPYHLTERLAYQGITDPTANVDQRISDVGAQLEKTTAGFVSLSEMWLRREDRLYQVYIAWNHTKGPRIVGFFQSPYDDPLYRVAIHRPLPGETYTNSLMEDVVELDSIQNDMMNSFIESVDREQGFIILGGSARRKDSFRFKGGSIWDLEGGDPKQDVNYVQPPNSSTNQLRAYQIFNGMMQSMGGSGTIAEGQPGRNMPRAGGAFNTLVELGMADIKDVAEIIEQEVLTPALSDIYKVSSFIPDSQLMRIPGGQAFYNGNQSDIISKADIFADVEFEWVGSQQFQDEAQNAQRMMIFLNLIPQLEPFLQQQGYTFNLVELVQDIWRYSLGQRNLNKIVIPLPQGPQGPGAQQPPPGTNGAQRNGTPSSNGVSGLKPTMPSATSGFIQR